MRITGFVPGLPIAQPRHRIGSVNGHAMAFEAKKTHPIHAWKATVRLALEAAGATPVDGPVSVVLSFAFPRPGRLIWKKRPMPSIPHTGRPDVDNLAKAFLDAANAIAFKDDDQVCKLMVMKNYVEGGGTPGLRFTIESEGAAIVADATSEEAVSPE